LAIHLHPLGADDLAVMPVAGGVGELVTLAFVAVLQGHRLRVNLETRGRREVVVISGGGGDANLLQDAVEFWTTEEELRGGVVGPDDRFLHGINLFAVDIQTPLAGSSDHGEMNSLVEGSRLLTADASVVIDIPEPLTAKGLQPHRVFLADQGNSSSRE